MTSLGRLIFFDQPGIELPILPHRCAADLGVLGRQHHGGARRSRESRSGPLAVGGALHSALFAATHPSAQPRWSCSRGMHIRLLKPMVVPARGSRRDVGNGELHHFLNPDCRGTRRSGQRGPEWNALRQAQEPLLS